MLWTFKDQIQSLRDFLENKSGNAELRRLKRAIFDAHRDLAGAQRWKYYTDFYQFAVVAAYSTGTIAFDMTGGSSELMVTLTTGTWPSWAALGTIVIDSVPYKVATRVSGSIITLGLHTNPGADVVAGTSYSLYQDCYRLPAEFVSLESVQVLGSAARPMCQMGSQELSSYGRQFITPSQPVKFTVMGDPNYQGRNCLRLYPPPSSAEVVEIIQHRMPRLPVIEEESTGTVATSAASATITGTGTAFDDTMIGCCLRIGSTSEAPTGNDGDDIPLVERVIVDVTSATVLTVDAVIDTTYTGKGFTISDIIDVDQVTMLNAFQRGCESQLALNFQNRDEILGYYEHELMLARERDEKVLERQTAGGRPWAARYRYPPLSETG